MKKTVVFDFDGVINSYKSGWTDDDVLPDPIVPGIREAIEQIYAKGYKIVVMSARARSSVGVNAIKQYLKENDILQYISDVTNIKPPAWVYIDDRAICFDGNPSSLWDKIDRFKPWNK